MEINLSAKIMPGESPVKMERETELKKACQEFEALFVGQIFKSMRKTVPEGGLVKKGSGERIYMDMLDMELASNLSKEKGVGLAQVLYNQLRRDGLE